MIWWNALTLRARAGLLVAATATLVALALATWWIWRVEHAVLFSDLRPQDGALMSAELDKLKVPYTVADNGATLLVDRAQVHAVRLKLMGRELPLNGTVGLELFNHVDFGMTEFAQKINYQRALQGELTRTILALAEIRDARVHLALPEQGLFKQNAARPKAAITLAMRPGQALRGDQVSGIQRLVAAAVPGLHPQEVTIVDQQGSALSRSSESDGEGAGGSARLDLKRETESYLSRKVGAVLEKAVGLGQALASVDVTLNMDQVRVTTEDVIPAPDARGATVAGVLVRERESARDTAPPESRSADGRGARGSSMQRDAEYQAGRRVEQVVTQAGAIRRLHVAAVVRQPLGEEQKDQLQRLVAAAVGAQPERGDTVVLQWLQPVPAEVQPPLPVSPAPAPGVQPSADGQWKAAALVALVVAAILLIWRRTQAVRTARLTDAQRRAALQRVQGWLLQGAPATVVNPVSPRGAE